MVTLRELLGKIDVTNVFGDRDSEINEVCQLSEQLTKNQISWCSKKHKKKLTNVKEGTVILEEDSLPLQKNKLVNYIVVNNPRQTFLKVLQLFDNLQNKYKFGVEPTASIAESSSIDSSAYIGHYVVIEDGVIVGRNTKIDANTVVKSNTQIGNQCTIGANCTIGGVGFGYERNNDGKLELMPHLGNVVIEDNVEIGNNTCIDRGVVGSTRICEGVKVDNLVHIAHGATIGNNSMVIANAMIAGSTQVGNDVWVAPSSSIINGVQIADNATIGMGAVVVKPVDKKQTIVGNPGKPISNK